MIRGQDVFDHLLDNLYAMEDSEIIDDKTIIGTATFPDWIMGGELTSWLWIRELPNGNIMCLRPLYNDDISTKDRQYELIKGKDDDKIEIVEAELERLRYLASLPCPFEQEMEELAKRRPEQEESKSIREIQHSRNRRRFFGI